VQQTHGQSLRQAQARQRQKVTERGRGGKIDFSVLCIASSLCLSLTLRGSDRGRERDGGGCKVQEEEGLDIKRVLNVGW
jgi:hypothetical protein